MRKTIEDFLLDCDRIGQGAEKEAIVEMLNDQVLKHIKISLVCIEYNKREHLRLAASFQRAGLAILEALAE